MVVEAWFKELVGMERAPLNNYLLRHRLRLMDNRLGDGKDGDVFQTDRPSALKQFKRGEVYRREFRAYQLFKHLSIESIEGFQLPRLIHYDDEAWLIEMTIVSPPFFLDFASTYDEEELEHLGFSDEVWIEREQYWADIFGDQWHVIRNARDTLVRLSGLFHLDLSRNNIRFR